VEIQRLRLIGRLDNWLRLLIEFNREAALELMKEQINSRIKLTVHSQNESYTIEKVMFMRPQEKFTLRSYQSKLLLVQFQTDERRLFDYNFINVTLISALIFSNPNGTALLY
jgi:hypothetical protein